MPKFLRDIIEKLYFKYVGVSDIVLGTEDKAEDYIGFEQEIVSLLKKYKVYDDTNAALQQVEIKCKVGDLPRIKTEFIYASGLKRKETK